MTSRRILLTFFAIFAVLVTLYSFQDFDNYNQYKKISTRVHERFQNFTKQQAQLIIAIKSGNETAIKNQYFLLRKYFKSWQYLAEYKHSSIFKEYINGAPLPKAEKNSFGANILHPKGMQVLDELIFSELNDSSKIKCVNILEQMQTICRSLESETIYYDYEIFTAARLQLIRIFTLGITGFDTPGSLNGIKDAWDDLNTIGQDIELYYSRLPEKDTLLKLKTQIAINSGLSQLSKNNNFNSFNRVFFYKTCIGPLYTYLRDIQSSLNIETLQETQTFPKAVNLESNSIFDNDFLQSTFYSEIPVEFRTEETAVLGKLLFFDPIFSANLKRSCASCHNPELAFSDGKQKSLATNQSTTLQRNSPGLINAIFTEHFFYDLRAESPEDQFFHVLTSNNEFNSDIFTLVDRLNQSTEYKLLFENTFRHVEGKKITSQTITFALSAYISSLYSFNSVFDKYMRNETIYIDPKVINGFNLFMGKAACGTCHFAPVFNGTVPPDYTESESEVLGVPEIWPAKQAVLDSDQGRAAAKLKDQFPFYQNSFKTSTVRNIEVTGPYMHNGSMKTVDDVISFYNKGGGNGIGLHLSNQTLSPDPLNLSKKEIREIKAFIFALTDYSTFKDPVIKLPHFENNLEWNKRIPGGEY